MALKSYDMSEIYKILMSGIHRCMTDIKTRRITVNDLYFSKNGSLMIKSSNMALISYSMMDEYGITDLQTFELFFQQIKKHSKDYLVEKLYCEDGRDKAKLDLWEKGYLNWVGRSISELLYGNSTTGITIDKVIELIELYGMTENVKLASYDTRSQVSNFDTRLENITNITKLLNIDIPDTIITKAKGEVLKYSPLINKIEELKGKCTELDASLEKAISELEPYTQCRHQNIEVDYGFKGFKVLCTECLMEFNYHPLLGSTLVKPCALYRLEYLETELKESIAKHSLKNNYSNLINDVREKLATVKDSLSVLDAYLPAISQYFNRVNELINAVEIGNVHVKSNKYQIGSELINEISSDSISQMFNRILDEWGSGSYQPLKVEGFRTIELLVIIKAIESENKSYGVATFTTLLSGSKSQKLVDYDLESSPYYGMLAKHKQQEITNAIKVLKDNCIVQTELVGRRNIPLLYITEAIRKQLNQLIEDAMKEAPKSPNTYDVFKGAIEGNNVSKLKEMCDSNFAFSLYLQAAQILIPQGKASKISKKVIKK